LICCFNSPDNRLNNRLNNLNWERKATVLARVQKQKKKKKKKKKKTQMHANKRKYFHCAPDARNKIFVLFAFSFLFKVFDLGLCCYLYVATSWLISPWSPTFSDCALGHSKNRRYLTTILVPDVAGKRGIVMAGYSPVSAPRNATISSTSFSGNERFSCDFAITRTASLKSLTEPL